ncbi:hypothetical protein M9Y10_014418 [Tritrichomonas musculus]|uniref:F5/8 type C domain-containing protein n=1 Tax=Tritrichomonas musculus TaxID=1915356 RepID=A0ABR2L0F4_9EUKA
MEVKHQFVILYESEQKKFDGIIAHLHHLTGQNPVKNGTIKIISPTKSHFEYPLYNLVEYGEQLNDSYWNFGFYNPQPNENWLLFDFMENRYISITAYTIRSGGSSHPKSWIFEGSNDKNTWTKIHEIHNCTLLNYPRATHTFIVEDSENKSQSKSCFRFIRFVQLENMSQKNEKKYRINLKAIEFFGHCYTVNE